MKNNWMWIGMAIVVILVAGYVGRNRIKMMLTGYAPYSGVTTTVPYPSTASPSSGIVMTKTDAAKGNYLVGANGMTLYIFDKDQQGVSNCNDNCAALWPPYLAGQTGSSAMPANMTAIKRADGSMQYASKGMPLYSHAKDKQVGDLNGDGVGGVWHLVKP